MEPIIRMHNVNFIYNRGKDNEFQALINITLKIYPEEFIIVFGPSGCGKSTLLNVIAGLERPDDGSISVFDKNMMTMNKKEFAGYHRAQVGMIYQAYNLVTSLSVLDNVALPQIFVNVRKRKREKWSKSLLERFGILQHANKIPTELSGGQQQRIGIARAIVNNPQLVLADEPVGNLDSVSAKNVLEILKELNEKEKKTIILVTHNPENLSYGDRIIYMKDGIITRETVNRRKGEKQELKEIVTKAPSDEIKEIMRTYHGLSPEQINILIMPYKAKVFAHHFITNRNMEEAKVFEDVIQRRLLGTISLDEFFDILNRSSSEGGVGFDSRTAAKIVRRVRRLLRIAYFIYQKGRQRKNVYGRHDKINMEEKADKLTDYLLKTCYLEYYRHLDQEQLKRLRLAVKNRLEAKIQKSEFYNYLDTPFKEGGVGLNSKTARAITNEIELILILGFGIVQREMGEKEEFTPRASDKKEKEEERADDGGADDGEKENEKKEDGGEKKEAEGAAKPADSGSGTAEPEPKTESAKGAKDEKGKADENAPPKPPTEEMTDADIEQVVKDVVRSMGGAGMKDFGRVMGQTLLRIGGRADYDRMAKAVKKVLLFQDVINSSGRDIK